MIARATLEIDKFVKDTDQQEIQRHETKDCANVRRVDDERVARNAEDRRDRVDSEKNVGDLNHDQYKSQRRQQSPGVAPHGEACTVVGIAHGHQPAHEPDQRIALRYRQLSFC